MAVLVAVGKNYSLEVLIDDIDYDWAVSQGNWFVTHGAHEKKVSGYAVRSVKMESGKFGLIWLHKEILKRHVGLPPSPKHIIGDHLNGIRLDNRRSNLRWATVQMNARNHHGFASRQLELL